MKINKRNILTVILSALCAVLLACSVCTLSGLSSRAQTSGNLTGAGNVIVDELTLTGYNSSNGKVFSYNNLSKLYSALTGVNGATLQTVANSVTGTDVSYGTSTTTSSGAVTIPKYVSAKDLYNLNNKKNILVDFGGQQWTVTFLTRDFNGDVIATLWLADAYKNSNGQYSRSPYSWYTSTNTSILNSNTTSASATTYLSNMYSSSYMRVKTLNGGAVNGAATKYAWNTNSASVSSTLNTAVSESDRIASDWAIFTLDNSALNNTTYNTAYTDKMNKSLVDFIDTPSQLKYSYYLDFNYQIKDVSGSSVNSYQPNEALNKDIDGLITGNTSSNTIQTGNSNKAQAGIWNNAYVASVANTNYTAGVGYNDWGHDRIWLPSMSETGAVNSITTQGLWQVAYASGSQTGQLNFMSGNTTAPTGISWYQSNQTVINSYEYIWLRSSYCGYVALPNCISSAGASINLLDARTLGVRPALHLNLTQAEKSSVMDLPANVTDVYTGAVQSLSTLTAKPDWYISELFSDTTQISVTYNPSSVINAGTYTATVEILSSCPVVWSDYETNTSSTRTFTFTITKKPIAYTLSQPSGLTYDGTTSGVVTPSYTGVIAADTGQPTGPDLAIYYKSADGYGYGTGTDDDSGKGLGSLTAPTLAGQYTATAVDLNSATSNYTMSGSPVNFEIKPKGLNLISVGTATKVYNGSAQIFQLTGSFNASEMDIVRTGYTLDSNNGYSDGVQWDPVNNRITAQNAGKYDFSFTLKDTRNTCWLPYPSTGAAYDVAVKPVNLEITQFDVSNNISLDSTLTTGNTGTQWGLGEPGKIVLSVSALGTDSVTLYIDYCSASDLNTPYRAGTDDSTLSLDTSQIVNVDNYVLRARLQTNSDSNYSADNANYTIPNDYWTFNFNIGAGAANVKLNWTYTVGGGIPTPLFDASGLNQVKLEYNGQAYDLAATVDSSTSYARLDTAAHTGYVNGLYTARKDGSACDRIAVGTYVTRIALVVDSDHEFDAAHRFTANDGTHGWVEIEWTIDKCELDLTNAEWEYSYDLNTWYSFNNDGDPEYDAGGVYVRINESYLNGLGLDSTDPDSVAISYNNGSYDSQNYAWFMEPKGVGYYAYAEVTVIDDNYTTVSGTNIQNIQRQFEITAQKITVTWSSTGLSFPTLDGTSDTYGISKAVDKNGNDCSSLFTYEFTFTDTAGTLYGPMTLADAQTFFAANASNTNVYSGTVTAVLTNANDYVFNGADNHTFNVGKSLPTILVTVTGSGSQYKNVSFGFAATFNNTSYAQYLNVSVYDYNDYYNGGAALITKLGSEATDIELFLNGQNAGKYVIEVVAVPGSTASSFVIRPDVVDFDIVKCEVVAPTVANADQIIYKASDYSILDYLSGFDPALMELDAQHSDVTGKTAKDYTVTINLLDKNNYVFVYPASSASPSKVLLKAVLTDGTTASTNATISADGSSVDIGWTIQKFVITDDMFSSTTGVLNLPAQFNDILANEMLQVGYQYYTDKTSSETITELKPGETYYVVASLGGECASNFVFDNPSLTSETTSQRVTFKTQQSGFGAVLGKMGEFLKGTWLGLPIWAWLVIGLAVLILLIIIIVVACKRRKSKEERAEAKARKEEERQLQREKLEAERELAKAKQEAELEKIRAQAGLAAGAGMAGVAMQQSQPQPQQMQQPVQTAHQSQPQTVQYASDSSALAEIRAELAEIRARQNAVAGYAQPPMQQTPMQYMNDPVAAAELIRLKAENEAHLRAELERSRSETERARAEAEIAKVRAENSRFAPFAPQYDAMKFGIGNDMEKIGALAVAIWKSMNSAQSPVELKSADLPQIAEESASVQTAHAVYPPDSVVTTTTTVDTTKGKPIVRKRDEDGNFDIDGFYDNADF
ncbi:MAG: hypothetical protein K2J83_07365 [Clostridia bacterium]|nr:hypothetical protein [Clostridia bacterium]